MMTTYSPHREGSSPVHLTSPNHLAHFDPHAAIREIRRSLSRSPSRTAEFRQYSFRQMSPTAGSIPFHPSPLSPSKRACSDNYLQFTATQSPHQRTTPGRFVRPSIRRTAQTQSVIRCRTSPKSPSKRALADSSDSGNSSPMPLRKRSSTEAEKGSSISEEMPLDKENSLHQEELAAWKSMHTRQEKRRSGGNFAGFVPPRSPMKRTDSLMGTTKSEIQSPSAKRRSVHGAGLDFSIFESDSLGSFNESRSQDDNDWLRSNAPTSGSSRFSTIPKRSSSLRKSTLQQRQSDRVSNMKLSQTTEMDGSWFDATPATKKPLRLSLDNHLAPIPRESPFSAQGNLLNASIHPLSSVHNSQEEDGQPQSQHPLSRTLTQSSSTSSFQDDSPTHEPFHHPNRPRSHDFSKSLPIGATRPSPLDSGEHSSQGSFATPGNYKSAKPLPAAFMSTGLISKKNRNAEEPNGGLPKAHMPDTPCKKQSVVFPQDGKYMPMKPAVNRASRQSFGTPSTPLDMSNGLTKASIFPFTRSIGIFGARSSKPTLMRKTSFASIDGDEKAPSQSPSGRGDSQSTDMDFPPTPTKHPVDDRKPSVSPSPNRPRNIPLFQTNIAQSQSHRFSSSKLLPIKASPGSVDGDSDSIMEDSPSASLRPKSAPKVVSMPGSSFTHGRLLRNLNSPTPLSRKALAIQTFHSPALERAKMNSLSPVSPHLESFDTTSPRTPLEGIFPPDPSSLSISGFGSGAGARPASRNGPPIPATPTGPREYFPNFSNRPSLNLNAPEVSDVDSSLTSRFQKVDLIGTGEFSQVYRVSQPPETSPYHKIYSVSTSRPPSSNSTPDRVWAVKKSRYAYAGAKDRQRKIHEVDVLKALGHTDHIVAFIDSWEQNNHLYIQTEFCEEGTLDVFLAQVGLRARLDDFRIWKILLELSLGLKHIHDCGYIHLDLKPANILITFEGVLKIGDFGMATKWPAKSGIEGEGDREYIGPEILMGKYDKPADIFALGLIMLETAGNVELPDNGASWQKLRNGDMSDVPSLTWSSEASTVFRDSSGNPIPEDEVQYGEDVDFTQTGDEVALRKSQHSARSGELLQPPQFMIDSSHSGALDNIVRWMICPDPLGRPITNEILEIEGVRWAETRRRAGATVFEGNWGPADEVLAEDAEMIDV